MHSHPPLERVFIKPKIMHPEGLLPTNKLDTAEWNETITKVQGNWSLLSRLRGGRVNASSINKSRESRIPKQDRVTP